MDDLSDLVSYRCAYCILIFTTPYFTTIPLASSLTSKDHFDTSYVVISKVLVELFVTLWSHHNHSEYQVFTVHKKTK